MARRIAIIALFLFLAARLGCGALRAPRNGAAEQPVQLRGQLDSETSSLLMKAGWGERVGPRLGLWVSVARQHILGIEGKAISFAYRCSTAARGTGSREGSNQTPLGWHIVDEKIGDGSPIGAIFIERKFGGKVWTPDTPTEKDYVLTRILWLRGLEPGLNAGAGVDSHERFIYIHGTPAEKKLGTPASMGCIRMANTDVVELFDATPSGTPVLITDW